ncbi:hypothetical protein GQR58_017398 [Nymphon striatum]|nr:hypothetical protein GQR58_017398 [Nymphon striatum]
MGKNLFTNRTFIRFVFEVKLPEWEKTYVQHFVSKNSLQKKNMINGRYSAGYNGKKNFEIIFIPTFHCFTMPPGERSPMKIVDNVFPPTYLEGSSIDSRTLHSLTSSTFACMQLLSSWGLLKNEQTCERCNVQMPLQICNRRLDGYTWRCRLCSKVTNIEGSFFQGSKLLLYKLIEIIYYWSIRTPAILEVHVTWETIVDWYNFLRDIYESFVMPPKHLRGRVVSDHWVLGMVERGENCCILIEVADRSAQTLIPVIMNHVLPGSIVMTDGWSSYRHGSNDLDTIRWEEDRIITLRDVFKQHQDVVVTGIVPASKNPPLRKRKLHFTKEESRAITSGNMLSDESINFSLILLSEQFPNFNGFFDICVLKLNNNMTIKKSKPLIQILHTGAFRWICVRCIFKQYIYDSLCSGSVTSIVACHLAIFCYTTDKAIEVTIQTVQQQSNGTVSEPRFQKMKLRKST